MLLEQSSLRKLGSVFQQVPDPWWLIDLDTSRFLDANQASIEQLGYSLPEILKIGVIDVNQAVKSREAWQEITAGIPVGNTVRFLSELKCKSGDLIPVEVTFSRVKTDDGEALLAFTRDLSKIVALEEELKQQQRLLRKLSIQVPGVLYRLEKNGRDEFVFSYMSDASRALLNVEPANDSLAYNLTALLEQTVPEDRDAVLAALQESGKTLGPLQCEFRIVGSERPDEWYEMRASPERTADGETIWHGFIADVTERKLAEIEMRRRQALWDMAANATGIGVVQFRDDGINMDDRAARAHGRRGDAATALSVAEWLRLAHPDDREVLQRRLEDLKAKDEACQARYRLVSRSEGKQVLELHARRFVRKPSGTADIVGTCRDVTDQVLAEAARREKEAAERANRAKTEFLSRMSHELRTPLNGILGYAQLLRLRGALCVADRKSVQTVEMCGNHLLALINDILDLSRIEIGGFELHAEAVKLTPFLQTVADLFRLKAQQKKLQFVFLTEGSLPATVRADERRLLQVLFNLVGNAMKFTDQGEVRLTVTALASDSDEAHLKFEVRDSGVGIRPEDIATVFEPFKQVGEVSRRAEGTGLGLTITRALVQQMGGSIHVESELGRGSRFWFEIRLPLAEEGSVVQPVSEGVKGYLGERRRVLIADDVDDCRGLLSDMLSSLGFQTSEAANGKEALALALSEKPDLILVDHEMPLMGGVELIRRLRREAASSKIPIIAVSAAAGRTDREESLAVGADAFLPKPVNLQELLATIGAKLALQWAH